MPYNIYTQSSLGLVSARGPVSCLSLKLGLIRMDTKALGNAAACRDHGGVSLYLTSSKNEFSWYHIFAGRIHIYHATT